MTPAEISKAIDPERVVDVAPFGHAFNRLYPPTVLKRPIIRESASAWAHVNTSFVMLVVVPVASVADGPARCCLVKSD